MIRSVRLLSLKRQFHYSSPRLKIIPFLLADIGEGITECEIVAWHVKPGDTVEQFSKICEVQSDKAAVEITSRYEGVIKSIKYEVGQIAKVGSALVDIDVPDDVPATVEEVAQVESSPKVAQVDKSHVQIDLADKSYTLATPSVRRLAKENNLDLKLIQ